MTLLEQDVFSSLIREANKIKGSFSSEISSPRTSPRTGPVISSDVELEFRMRAFPPRTTHQPVVHERIYELMKKRVNEKFFEYTSDTVEIYDDNIRRITVDGSSSSTYQRKVPVYEYENRLFALKSTVSREESLVSTFALPQDAKAKLIRKRERTRIPYEGLLIDLTRVSPVEGGGRRAERRFEIEIEVPSFSTTSYETINKALRLIFRCYRSTNIIYTISMYEMMAKFFNDTLSADAPGNRTSSQTGDFYDNLLSRTRGLKMQDLVYGGIVGPKHQYSVTPKADGDRAVILFHTTGLWVYVPSGTLNCIVMTRDFSELHGTILDCESIPESSRLTVRSRLFQYLFLVFDCLAVSSNFSKGTTLIQNEDHQVRMQTAQSVIDQTQNIIDALKKTSIINISTKRFSYFNNASQFFESMEKMSELTEENLLPYKTDGFIFTPRNTRAIPYAMIHTIPINKRNLVDYPDIVKWKPKSKLTIDFIVDVDKRQLLSGGAKHSLVPFSTHGFDMSENVAWAEFIDLNITKDTVWECNWDESAFHPYRERYDKPSPNNLEVAISNFKELIKGIHLDTLLGKTTKLLRKYHNRVKSNLYDIACTRHYAPTILDLGSGRGGDLSKWKTIGAKRVYAVEPDEDNMREFMDRLSEIRLNCQLINCGAEDTEKIEEVIGEGGKVDIISSMLSGSFFWRDDETLKKVVNTIKTFSRKGSLFIIFTINGQLMDEVVKPSLREGLTFQSPMKLGEYTFDFHEESNPVNVTEQTTGKRYTVSIPGSIVGVNQTEYKVYLDLLTKALVPEFELVSHQIADMEQFLPTPYLMVTKMYSFAIYERIL